MNKEKYLQILFHCTVPSGKCLIGGSFVFPHDKDPRHPTSAEKAYLDSTTSHRLGKKTHESGNPISFFFKKIQMLYISMGIYYIFIVYYS